MTISVEWKSLVCWLLYSIPLVCEFRNQKSVLMAAEIGNAKRVAQMCLVASLPIVWPYIAAQMPSYFGTAGKLLMQSRQNDFGFYPGSELC